MRAARRGSALGAHADRAVGELRLKRGARGDLVGARDGVAVGIAHDDEAPVEDRGGADRLEMLGEGAEAFARGGDAQGGRSALETLRE